MSKMDKHTKAALVLLRSATTVDSIYVVVSLFDCNDSFPYAETDWPRTDIMHTSKWPKSPAILFSNHYLDYHRVTIADIVSFLCPLVERLSKLMMMMTMMMMMMMMMMMVVVMGASCWKQRRHSRHIIKSNERF